MKIYSYYPNNVYFILNLIESARYITSQSNKINIYLLNSWAPKVPRLIVSPLVNQGWNTPSRRRVLGWKVIPSLLQPAELELMIPQKEDLGLDQERDVQDLIRDHPKIGKARMLNPQSIKARQNRTFENQKWFFLIEVPILWERPALVSKGSRQSTSNHPNINPEIERLITILKAILLRTRPRSLNKGVWSMNLFIYSFHLDTEGGVSKTAAVPIFHYTSSGLHHDVWARNRTD